MTTAKQTGVKKVNYVVGVDLTGTPIVCTHYLNITKEHVRYQAR